MTPMSHLPQELRSFITHQVEEGFDSPHDIIENASDLAIERHGREDLKPQIKRFTLDQITRRQRQQADWETSTDCDRLDRAFDALNQSDIVARHNFSCCTNCGHTEIWDEIHNAEQHRPVEGYVFYHFQCIEHAMKSGQLMLAYGTVHDDPASLTAVVSKILAELRRAGLDPTWQGTADYPIVLQNFVWRRRR
jgi:hypothetical protein